MIYCNFILLTGHSLQEKIHQKVLNMTGFKLINTQFYQSTHHNTQYMLIPHKSKAELSLWSTNQNTRSVFVYELQSVGQSTQFILLMTTFDFVALMLHNLKMKPQNDFKKSVTFIWNPIDQKKQHVYLEVNYFNRLVWHC